MAAIWVLAAWLYPVSANHYNPSKAHSNQEIPSEAFMPPPEIHPKYKTTRKQTDKEIEQWRADRSDLAAQWKAADMSQLAFRIGVLGVILLSWTIYQTLDAGAELRRQNEIALIGAELEHQPYLSASEMKAGSNTPIILMPYENHASLYCRVDMTNNGKTPIYIRSTKLDFSVHFLNKFPCVHVDRAKAYQPVEIMPNDSEPIYVIMMFKFPKEISDPKAEFLLSSINAKIIIEYDDAFSLKTERTKKFSVAHGGSIIDQDVGEFTLRLVRQHPVIELDKIHPSKHKYI